MKILIDENIPRVTVRELQKLGHEVKDIRGTEHEGIDDDELWEMAQKNGMLLITTDKGFALKRHEKHNGVLIIRLKQPNRLKIHQKAMQAMNKFKEREWPGLTVVMQDVFHSVWRFKKRG